jgi:hypothetical protein
MRKLIVVLIVLVTLANALAAGIHTIMVDPTGTYILDSKTYMDKGETYGYMGVIQVKPLTTDRIVMTFYINKGAPSYNSGSFVDTLNYDDNKSVYKIPKEDASCRITFTFTEAGVTVKESTADINSGCGFGHAVVANGFFKKVNPVIPLLVDPGTDNELK